MSTPALLATFTEHSIAFNDSLKSVAMVLLHKNIFELSGDDHDHSCTLLLALGIDIKLRLRFGGPYITKFCASCARTTNRSRPFTSGMSQYTPASQTVSNSLDSNSRY